MTTDQDRTVTMNDDEIRAFGTMLAGLGHAMADHAERGEVPDAVRQPRDIVTMVLTNLMDRIDPSSPTADDHSGLSLAARMEFARDIVWRFDGFPRRGERISFAPDGELRAVTDVFYKLVLDNGQDLELMAPMSPSALQKVDE